MTWVAVAVGGASLVGSVASGVMGSHASESAANTQANAANRAADISQNQFNTITQQENPYMQSGYGGLSSLNYLLGNQPEKLGTNGTAYTPLNNGSYGYAGAAGSPNAIGANQQFAGYGQLPGSAFGGQPANNGRMTAGQGMPTSGYFPQQGGPQGPQGGNPYSAMGHTGFGPQGVGTGYGGLMQPFQAMNPYPALQPFTADTFKQYSPNYKFQQEQGMQGVLNGAAGNAGSLSGAAQKDLASFNQNLANNSFDNAFNQYLGQQNQGYNQYQSQFSNAFNQYQTQQGNIYGRLMGLSQLGQNAAANTGSQGTQLAGMTGQNITNAGSAAAAGKIGSANAWSSAIQGAVNSPIPWLMSSTSPTPAAPGGAYGGNGSPDGYG